MRAIRVHSRPIAIEGRPTQVFVASVKHGYWYSRSHEFVGQGLMPTLRWLQMFDGINPQCHETASLAPTATTVAGAEHPKVNPR